MLNYKVLPYLSHFRYKYPLYLCYVLNPEGSIILTGGVMAFPLPVVKETAETKGVESAGLPSTSEVARGYIRGIKDGENGSAIDVGNYK